ncbi:MAG: T9SS type A sorting domain-containing protein, partial [candidate division WOR-3 bacterium]|nr:T9SS type A sorting domain-containing protein [candidate division WOR-3 bacterium]
PWPGGLNRTLFDSISTIPNTKTNYPTPSGLITGCYVKDISNSSPVMSCTLSSGIIGTFIGGPDAFGYTYLDSDTIDGPIYNWIDITQTGIILGSGDDVRYSLSLPFQFYFYGRTYNRVWVCTNGWLSFGPDPGNSSPNNTSLPNTSLPNRTIYVFWDDLNLIPSNGGKIYYQILGNAPNRYCVITWQDAQIKQVLPGFLRPINPITFQVILYENGQILLQYKDCAVGDTLYNWGRSATIGIEDSTGTVGLQYLYNGTPLGNLLAGERAIQFTRPVYKDIAVIQIDYPTGTIESTATTIVPQVKVRNNGYNIETFDVTLRISNLYLDVRSKTLLPGTEDTVQFQEWIPIRGTFTARCSVHLENDIERSNDTLQVNFTVNVRDFSAKTISAPLSPVQYGDTVIPKVWIHNYGSIDETTVPVTFYIPGTGYNSTLYIDLAHRDSVELSFDPLVVDFDQGSYSMRCTTKLNNDAVPSNNLATALLTTLVPGWVEMCTIPTMPPGKGIKDGGALAIVQNKIYALQGGNTSYLYQYDIESNDWITKPPIPYLEEEGRIYKRNVKAGGSLVAMGRTLYAFKGGNTSEFWAYLTENDSWIRRASIPEQESLSLKTTKVKTGGALVAHRCSIYAFKGGNTNEFWLYNPNTDSWYQRKSLITSDGKKIKGGACLVALNDTIYAFVGGNTYHFYAYTPDTWVKKADAKFGYNYSSTKKKIKDGAALVATADGKIYAFKGGNTKDLGCYDIALDTWFYVDTIPGIRRVKYGGALASYEYSLYAMKGGNNSEFWRYTPPITKSNLKSQMANMPILTDNTKLKTQNTNFILTVSPNPFSKFTTIRYNIPVAGKVTIKLYDATGKLVKTLVEKYHDVGTYSIKLNADNLTKGLYFLRFFSIINYMTVKLTLP